VNENIVLGLVKIVLLCVNLYVSILIFCNELGKIG
jgi:hypothetical protein